MSGVKKYPVTPETKAVVLGAGIIGMGAFEYLKSRGVKNIVVVDVCEARLEKAKECGAIPFNNKNGGLKEFLVETYGEGDPGMFSMIARPVPDVDLYIDCIGNNKLLDEILNMTKYEAQITILSLFHTKPEVNMANFLFANVKMVGSIMFDENDVFEAIELLNRDKSIAKEMISHEIPFENAVEAFDIANNPVGSLKVMLVSE